MKNGSESGLLKLELPLMRCSKRTRSLSFGVDSRKLAAKVCGALLLLNSAQTKQDLMIRCGWGC